MVFQFKYQTLFFNFTVNLANTQEIFQIMKDTGDLYFFPRFFLDTAKEIVQINARQWEARSACVYQPDSKGSKGRR